MLKTDKEIKVIELNGSGGQSLMDSEQQIKEEAGSNLVYAAAYNLGYEEGSIPQRRYLGIDDIAEDEILDVIRDHYSKAFQ